MKGDSLLSWEYAYPIKGWTGSQGTRACSFGSVHLRDLASICRGRAAPGAKSQHRYHGRLHFLSVVGGAMEQYPDGVPVIYRPRWIAKRDGNIQKLWAGRLRPVDQYQGM